MNIKDLRQQHRTYHFIDGRTVALRDIVKVAIYDTGCHGNHAADGKVTIVPPWWDRLDIEIVPDLIVDDGFNLTQHVQNVVVRLRNLKERVDGYDVQTVREGEEALDELLARLTRGSASADNLADAAVATAIPWGFGEQMDGADGTRIGTNVATWEQWRQFFDGLLLRVTVSAPQ